MSNLNQILSQISLTGWIALAGAVLVLSFVWWSRANQPAFFDFLMNFPIRLFGPIGKLRELRKNTTNLNNKASWLDGMPAQERTLSSAYIDKMGKVTSERDFNNAYEYLEVTGQGSVKPMSLLMWAILFLLTMGEAAGTGALLSEFVSTNVTSNEAVFFTWGIAIILALVLLLLTHKAGAAYFEHKTFKDILGENDRESKPSGYHDGEDDMPFNGDQYSDRGKPQPVRFYARLEKKKARGSLGWSLAALVVLLIIMGTVFGARMYGISKQNTIEVTQMEKNGVAGADGGNSNPFASMGGSSDTQTALPPAVAKARADSRKRLANEIGADNLGQGFMASILLAVFYLIVQMVGFAMSMQRSFFQRGSDAYHLTGGCASYDEYLAKHFWPYANRAEARLTELRSAYARVNEVYCADMPTTTFVEYFHNKRASSRRAEQMAQRGLGSTDTATSGSPQGAPASMAADPESTSTVDLRAIAAEILALPDRNERAKRLKEVLKDMSESLQAELKDAMAKLKAETESKETDISAFEGLI